MRTILRTATTVLKTSAGLYRELALSALELLPRRMQRSNGFPADRAFRGTRPRPA